MHRAPRPPHRLRPARRARVLLSTVPQLAELCDLAAQVNEQDRPPPTTAGRYSFVMTNQGAEPHVALGMVHDLTVA